MTPRRIHPPFRAEHLGSFIRPQRLVKAREAWKEGKLPAPELRNLEDSLQAVDGNAAAEIFNEAVDRANNRDYDKAIALLSDLLPRVRDPELKARIETLLERLRADAARMRQPVR